MKTRLLCGVDRWERQEGSGTTCPEVISYGADHVALHRRAAHYVDRILNGAKPGDLPIEQPWKFELVLNMKTARALEVAIPGNFAMRADRVIE